jgi:CheY-like chemotaxis protein
MANDNRLLVVDDQPQLGEAVRRVGEALGYEVRVTAHADEFMTEYETFDPTLIVLDIVMPDVDGIELVEWLASRNCVASIIVASAYNPRYAQMAKTMGTVKWLDISFLEKPFRVAQLREMLSRWRAGP